MKNSQLLVSVLVPCYNQARYLPDALASVLIQTHPHWECIIINDGSTDDTGEVAREWLARDDRFKYVYKENGGLSSARNAGLKAAIGEYIQLLDADDVLEINKISHQLAFWKINEGKIDIVVSGYRYFQDSDKQREPLIFGPNNLLPEVVIDKDDKRDLIKLFATRNPMVVSAPLYHISVFQRIGGFDEYLDANEDWDFHFRCASGGIIFQHCGYAPDAKTLIRIHPESMITDRRNMIRNLRKFQQKHRENHEFALESGLLPEGYKLEMRYLIKLFMPPVVIWLARKILALMGR